VKCTSFGEFNRFRLALCQSLQNTIKGAADLIPPLIRARREFANASLVIEYGDGVAHAIEISYEIRWGQLSMLQKIAMALLFTINMLESMNGHLNHIVSRNNPFWASLCRIAEQIECGINKLTTYVQHNFNRATQKAWMSCHSLGLSEIDAQTEFYNSI
jgi:hypothetical protein